MAFSWLFNTYSRSKNVWVSRRSSSSLSFETFRVSWTTSSWNRFVIMDIIAFEAKLDMLDKRLKEAQKDRQRTEERFRKSERWPWTCHTFLIVSKVSTSYHQGNFWVGKCQGGRWQAHRFPQQDGGESREQTWLLQVRAWDYNDIPLYLPDCLFRLKAEEAAELADHNLNMFRRKQQELEEMEARLKEGNEVLQKLQKKWKPIKLNTFVFCVKER